MPMPVPKSVRVNCPMLEVSGVMQLPGKEKMVKILDPRVCDFMYLG